MGKLTDIPTVVELGPVQVFRPRSQVFMSHIPAPGPLDTDARNLRGFGNYGFEAYATLAQQKVAAAPVDDDPRSHREPRLQDVDALNPRKVG